MDTFRGGNGEPVLLLHGVWESWHSFSPVLAGLSAEHDVLAPTLADHPGGPGLAPGREFGIESLIEVICCQLDEAGFERPHVVGNSLGGWLAFELAKRGRARSVVAISPAGRWTDAETEEFATEIVKQHRAARLGLPILRRIVRTRRGRRTLLADNCSQPERIPPEEAERLLVALARCDVPGHLGVFRGAGRRLQGLEGLDCPVLLLWGKQDRVIPVEQASRFLADLPGARLVELDDCGHTAMFDQPEQLTRLILGFTRQS
jgi:pimeloyl-ACP methyl ester carboxylesterase